VKALRELQQDMQRYLLGEESPVIAHIVDAPPLPAADRLGIYRNAYQVRLIDALDSTYPILHALLGDEMFSALGEGFVAEHPSEFRSIRWYGSELAEFVSHHAPFDEQPIFSEIARLEWTLSEVFDAPDAKSLQRSDLAAIAPEDWEGLRFKFHPSLRRLELAWNTVAVWQAMSREDNPPDPQWSEEPVPWLLWRQDLQNYFRSLAGAESAALTAALNGHSFGEICEVLGAWIAPEEVPLAAANYLNAWTMSGLICEILTVD
jgi:hypothetical protein